MERYDAIIVAAGTPPDEALLRLYSGTFLCCCDSAAVAVIGMGITPDAIVGDGDSLPAEYKQRYAHIWHHESEQEDNDLTKATRFCVARGHKRILYLGCTGKREDHTLANVSLLPRYAREFSVEPVMLTPTGRFLVGNGLLYADGTQYFSSYPGQAVSIFNFGCTQLSSQGLKWPVYPCAELWQGTLNRSLGDSFSIKSNGFYLVFLND